MAILEVVPVKGQTIINPVTKKFIKAEGEEVVVDDETRKYFMDRKMEGSIEVSVKGEVSKKSGSSVEEAFQEIE